MPNNPQFVELQMELDDYDAEKLLRALIRKIRDPNFDPTKPRRFLGYKECHDMLGISMVGKTWGHSLQLQGMDKLAKWIKSNALPAVTGLIVDTKNSMPGGDFFKFYERAIDREWWLNEVRKSHNYDWSEYVGDLGRPTHILPTPVASDVGEPPERIETTVYRILRDTAKARRVKQLHEFLCQVCGETITLPDGRRYAEAHHIRPLGGSHNGTDEESNMLCLCPNHHAELDLFARALDLAELRQVPSHTVDQRAIEYHNSQVAKLKY